jgi:hypothetical protein
MDTFELAIDTTLSGWLKADGSPLSTAEKANITNFLRSEGLGNFAITNIIRENAKAPVSGPNVKYVPVFWSAGETAEFDRNVLNPAREKIDGDGVKTYAIADTNWGKFLN